MASKGTKLHIVRTEDLLTTFESLTPAALAELPSLLDVFTRTYAELSATVDLLASEIDRIRKLQGRISVLISRIKDAGPRPFQPSDGRPMPPSVPPSTTLPQDGHGEG